MLVIKVYSACGMFRHQTLIPQNPCPVVSRSV